ncbi:MAG: hypothetical protein RJA99_3130 [Pseudomonadota bacterium]|jgi:hypothetical protein
MDLSEFPPPPVPAGFSLQSPPPMPLSVEHLLDSPQYTEHAHLPIVAASWIRLRAKAWISRPAASLPASDNALAAIAGLAPEVFAQYRDAILEGFVFCSDGRLYDVELADRVAELITAHARMEELRQMKSAAGRASVAARKSKPKASATVIHSAVDETVEAENDPLAARAREVFAFWVETMGAKKAVLSGKRKTNLLKALKTYTVEDLKKAIKGCSLSPFHQGENDRNTKFNDLELITRDPAQVEKFMRFADSPPTVKKSLFGQGGKARPEDYRTDEPIEDLGWLSSN